MKYEISAGEVLEVIYSDDNPNLVYGLKVKEFASTPASDVAEVTTVTAKPLNTGFLRIEGPLEGTLTTDFTDGHG